MCYIKVETDNHPTDYSINKLIIKKNVKIGYKNLIRKEMNFTRTTVNTH